MFEENTRGMIYMYNNTNHKAHIHKHNYCVIFYFIDTVNELCPIPEAGHVCIVNLHSIKIEKITCI